MKGNFLPYLKGQQNPLLQTAAGTQYTTTKWNILSTIIIDWTSENLYKFILTPLAMPGFPRGNERLTTCRTSLDNFALERMWFQLFSSSGVKLKFLLSKNFTFPSSEMLPLRYASILLSMSVWYLARSEFFPWWTLKYLQLPQGNYLFSQTLIKIYLNTLK